MTSEQMYELFEKHNSEHLKFDRIPDAEKRHKRSDLCGMLLIADRIPIHGHGDVVQSASHDQIWFDGPVTDAWPFTEDDVIYLLRCGVCWDSATNCLYSFA